MPKRNIYATPILTVIGLSSFTAGILMSEPMPRLKIIIIVLLAFALLVIPVYRSIRQARDLKNNIPLEDELSHNLRIYSGAYAFRYSLISWLLIFTFNHHFPDPEAMIGVGILAAVAIYGIVWLQFRRKGSPKWPIG